MMSPTYGSFRDSDGFDYKLAEAERRERIKATTASHPMTRPMSEEERKKLERLEKAATPAPWRAMMAGNSRLLDGTHVGQARLEPVPRPYEPRWVGFQNEATALEWHHATVMREEDAELIAMMRNLLPALLSTSASERGLREALEEAERALSIASRILTDDHKVALNGKAWGESALANIRAALSPKGEDTQARSPSARSAPTSTDTKDTTR